MFERKTVTEGPFERGHRWLAMVTWIVYGAGIGLVLGTNRSMLWLVPMVLAEIVIYAVTLFGAIALDEQLERDRRSV